MADYKTIIVGVQQGGLERVHFDQPVQNMVRIKFGPCVAAAGELWLPVRYFSEDVLDDLRAKWAQSPIRSDLQRADTPDNDRTK